MVWAVIFIDWRTNLYVISGGSVTALRYRNEILEPIVRPCVGAIGETFHLVQDNDRAHTSRIARTYLMMKVLRSQTGQRGLLIIPIEHVCRSCLGHAFSWTFFTSEPCAERFMLSHALVAECDAIPQDMIRRVIRSMPRRCRECLNARGDILITNT
jgi:hypothetical protein